MIQRDRSKALFERAVKVMPGGNSRTTVWSAPFPLYAARGAGCRIWDVEGVERLDFLNNYTALIHGHAHPAITTAVAEQIANGTCFPMPTEAEVAHAELLCARIPSFERIRFANTGSEAVMMAVKLARAYTGRAKIAKTEGAYHGSYDPVEVSQDTPPALWGNGDPPTTAYTKGTPKGILDDTIVIPFNNAEQAERILRAHGRELACVLVDPVPNRTGMLPADPAYLATLRRVTQELGALLIFDEVISFRVGYRGAQGAFGIEPDVTSVGKIMGGGFPVGAVAGKAEFMALMDPRAGKPAVPHGGTFNANPVTMIAGRIAMEMMDEAAFARLNGLGDRLRRQAAEAFAVAGVPGQICGAGSLFRLHMTARRLSDYRSAILSPAESAATKAVTEAMLEGGILVSPQGMGCLSSVMAEAEVDRFTEVLLASLRAVAARGLAAE